jgi:tripartite-type tricarboxylate transporter receptor subunit TctC
MIAPNVYETTAGSPQQLAEHIRADTERWRKVVTDAKIAIEE